MPLKLTGGSVTLSIAVLVFAWSIRSLRDRRRRQRSPGLPPSSSSSKYFAEISLEALALLVHLKAVPYYVIDVRSSEDAAAAPLGAWLSAVNIPEPQLQTGLKQPAIWANYAAVAAAAAAAAAAQQVAQPWPEASTSPAWSTGATAATGQPDEQQQQQQQQQQVVEAWPLPTRHHLLVLVAGSEQQQRLAASRAAAAGFDRVVVPRCGIEQLLDVQLLNSSISRDQQVLSAVAAAAAHFPAIHADALAVLLGLVALSEGVWQLFGDSNDGVLAAAAAGGGAAAEGAATSQRQQQQQQRLLLLDVRRHDERTLYGTIPGAHHVPVDELPSALQLPPAAFRRHYHCEPPHPSRDVLVVHSRARSRALWAAQLCLDAGCKYVFVYPDGVLGWAFGSQADAYAAYQQGEKPPEPLVREGREPDVAAGLMELQQVGLMPLLMQQHGVTPSR